MSETFEQVAIEYTVILEDGTLVDSNLGKAPLVFSKGSNQVLPALEKALEGLKYGERKKVKLLPKDAYGVVDPKAFLKVDLDEIPEECREPGALINYYGKKGNECRVRVHEIIENFVILDLNHPLAGHTLVYDVKIVDPYKPFHPLAK